MLFPSPGARVFKTIQIPFAPSLPASNGGGGHEGALQHILTLAQTCYGGRGMSALPGAKRTKDKWGLGPTSRVIMHYHLQDNYLISPLPYCSSTNQSQLVPNSSSHTTPAGRRVDGIDERKELKIITIE